LIDTYVKLPNFVTVVINVQVIINNKVLQLQCHTTQLFKHHSDLVSINRCHQKCLCIR